CNDNESGVTSKPNALLSIAGQDLVALCTGGWICGADVVVVRVRADGQRNASDAATDVEVHGQTPSRSSRSRSAASHSRVLRQNDDRYAGDQSARGNAVLDRLGSRNTVVHRHVPGDEDV